MKYAKVRPEMAIRDEKAIEMAELGSNTAEFVTELSVELGWAELPNKLAIRQNNGMSQPEKVAAR